jgi:hypothetical protein
VSGRKVVIVLLIAFFIILGLCIDRGVVSAIRANVHAKNFDMEGTANVIMGAVINKDTEALKSMMGESMLANGNALDLELDKLIDFPKGDIKDYDYSDADAGISNRIENGRIKRRIYRGGSIDFNTIYGRYRIWFYYEVANTNSPENKGIRGISIYELDKDEFGANIEAKPEKLFDGTDNEWELRLKANNAKNAAEEKEAQKSQGE